ncbi:NAD(P)H-hydrate dehydratase [Caenispirillum salinarum]|uniref:NAD(P)H-hydrate dehydratase n=1 Tax=Caenispirillum salinarum TaxID=859058 RepID=UPI00384B8AC8
MFTDTALLTVEEMARADKAAAARGVPSLLLMESAGMAVANAIRARFPRRPVLVACGPGNNGGDGFVIARLLARKGWPVTVGLLGDPAKLKGDAKTNFERWRGPVKTLCASLLETGPLVVDALFGAGLARDLEGAALDVVEAINARGLDCVAVDVPSGIDGNTGGIRGAAPRCALTVTFFRRKPGHVLYPGRAHCGETVLADIGIPAAVLGDEVSPTAAVNGPNLWTIPEPAAEDHKYRRGHAVVVGGGAMTGAGRLAGRGARRMGAGMLTIAAPAEAGALYQGDAPGNIVKPVEAAADLSALLEDERYNAVLLGAGGGKGAVLASMVLAVLKLDRSVVLDADALTSFADDPAMLFEAVQGPTVFTPHTGEFSKIFPDLQGDKLVKSREAAKRSGAVVVLKGADTVIAGPDGRAVVNTAAPPTLATAGSGDVLGGMILGLMAQGMGPFEAACAGVWLHGVAGAVHGPGLIAEDIPDALPAVLAALWDDGNEE